MLFAYHANRMTSSSAVEDRLHYALSVETLSTTAQLYEKLNLKRQLGE